MMESPSTSISSGSPAAGLKSPGQSARAPRARVNTRPTANARASTLLVRVRDMTTVSVLKVACSRELESTDSSTKLAQKVFKQIKTYAMTIIAGGTNIVNRNDFLGHDCFGSADCTWIEFAATQRVLGFHAAQRHRRDAAQSYTQILNIFIAHLRRAGETNFGYRLRFSRTNLAIVVSQWFRASRQANARQQLVRPDDHLLVAGMKLMIGNPTLASGRTQFQFSIIGQQRWR